MNRLTTRVAALSIIAVLFLAGFLLFNPLGEAVNAEQDSIVRQNTSSLPPSLLPVVAESLGKTDSSYHINGSSASTPAHGLETHFSKQGVTFNAAESSFSLKLDSIGRGDQLAPVAKVADVTPKDNKIEYTRGDVTEWYINSPFGMEQGFTLSQRPEGEIDQVSISLNLETKGDLSANDSKNGKSIEFTNSKDQTVMSYGKLYVYDADGKELESSMKLNEDAIIIAFNDQGATYPVVVDPFVEVQMLFASNGNQDDFFGFSSAISGDFAILGAPDKGDGWAYIFEKDDTDVWNEVCRIRGADFGANCFLCGADFGESVDIFQVPQLPEDDPEIVTKGEDGVSGLAVIGAPDDDTGGFIPFEQGTAFIFERDEDNEDENCEDWSFKRRMMASSTQSRAHLGSSVSVTYGKVIAGAPDENWGGGSSGRDRGAAYIFEKNGSWPTTETQRITANDGGRDDEFGAAVAIFNNTALVGAPFWDAGGRNNTGAAYFFDRNGSWSQDVRRDPAEANDQFGQAVDLSFIGVMPGALSVANLAIVGAPDADISCGGCDEGEAYIFEKNGSWPVNPVKVASSNPQLNARFGTCVGISPQYAVVGAPLEDFDGPCDFSGISGCDKGAGYVFDRDGGSWSFEDRIIASDNAAFDFFARSCGVSNGYIVVGAPGKNIFNDIIVLSNALTTSPGIGDEKPSETPSETTEETEDPKDDPEGDLAEQDMDRSEDDEEESGEVTTQDHIEFDQGEGYIFMKEQTGRIKIIKETVPDMFVGDFGFEGSDNLPDGNPCESFMLSDGQMQDCGEIPAGEYEIIETEMLGATLHVECDSGDWTPIGPIDETTVETRNGIYGTTGVAINLQGGDDITCTFTNTLPLELSPIFPAVESNPNFMTASPVTTNGPVGFIWGFQLGTFPISLPCGNIELGINPFIFLGVFNAGANQIVNMTFFINLGGYANPAYAQAVDLTTCVVSDVVANIILNTNLN